MRCIAEAMLSGCDVHVAPVARAPTPFQCSHVSTWKVAPTAPTVSLEPCVPSVPCCSWQDEARQRKRNFELNSQINGTRRRDAGAERPTGARHAGHDGLKLSVDAAMNADSKRARFSAAAMPTWHFSCAAWLCPASCNKERTAHVEPVRQWVPWAQLSMSQHVRIGTGLGRGRRGGRGRRDMAT